DQARRAFAGIVFLFRVLQKLVEVALELLEAVVALHGFVEPKESEDDIRLHFGEPLIAGTKILRAMPRRDFVAGRGEISENEIVLSMRRDDEGLEVTRMLHAIGQGVAEERDVIAGLKLEAGGRLLSRAGGYGRESQSESESEGSMSHNPRSKKFREA